MTEHEQNAADLALRLERRRGDELAALVERMRKTLYLMVGDCRCGNCAEVQSVLALTPAAALEEHDREVREACAKIAETHRTNSGRYGWVSQEIAAAIRRGEGK